MTPRHWPQVERLFGANGACGGCWCQAWRIAPGEKWNEVQGATAKARLRRGVRAGTVHAVLAFEGETPIGWCTFGPRLSFPRLERARTLRCDDPERVWSLPCFFVARGHRQQGVARAMLEHAVRAMKRRGAEIAEGYPSKPDPTGRYIASFAWTGTRSLFGKAGFAVAGNAEGSKQRVRKVLGGGRRPAARPRTAPARSIARLRPHVARPARARPTRPVTR
jgi:GNAT superfamily N-acetyltransferase